MNRFMIHVDDHKTESVLIFILIVYRDSCVATTIEITTTIEIIISIVVENEFQT